MRNLLKLAVLSFALNFGTAGWAQSSPSNAGQTKKEEKRLEREARKLDREAAQAQGEDRVLARMSEELGIPVETLKQQKESSKLGFGDLFIADSLAKATNKTFEELLAEFQGGKGWGRIANENNVRLGEIISQAKRNANAVEAARRNEERRAAREAEARERPAETPGAKRGAAETRGPGSMGAGRPTTPPGKRP